MGCGGSKEEQATADITIVKDAKDAYNAAEADVITEGGKQRLEGEGNGILTEQERKDRLEQLFFATDDNGDGHVSVAEFTQLFDGKLSNSTDISDEVKALFAQIDTEPDAKLTKEEFMDFHLKKFAKL